MPQPKPNSLNWDAPEIAVLVRAALDEDLGAARGGVGRDITAEAMADGDAAARARILAKQELVLAGLPLADRVFRALDANIRFTARFEEGAKVASGAVIAQLEGRARAIFTAERTALNFLAHLSGIATLARRFVEAIGGTKTRIRDTRKTTPLLRALEKYAVRVGGAENHRFGLYDAMLIKENHIVVAGSIAEAVRRARRPPAPRETTAYESFRPPAAVPPVQVEVRNEEELRAALAVGADAVLLDNQTPESAARLVALARRENPACLLEISGGVNLANVRAFAEAGADFIAIGALTHSAPAADLSLLVDPPSVR